jgi:Raf kinase inhibitor-like YbhB/YbcL family protein
VLSSVYYVMIIFRSYAVVRVIMAKSIAGKRLYILGAAFLVILAAVLIFVILRGKDEEHMDISLSVASTAFENDGYIPADYTGKGRDISPPLEITGIGPEGKTIVIIMDDPDAPRGIFTHWLIWNIPVNYHSIPADVPKSDTVSILGGACQGMNDFNKTGYKGPLPPSGTHKYRIKAYVLDTVLDLKPGSDLNGLLKAMNGHILQYGLLTGKFSH